MLEQYFENMINVGKELVRTGLVTATWGNISCRLPEDNGFLVTPSGMDYENINRNDFVIVNGQGEIFSGIRKPTSELSMHLAIYENRPDVNAIVHTHSHYATAFAVARKSIPSIVEDVAMLAGGTVEVASYALPGSRELANNVVTTLKNKNGVLLANHGVVGVGRNLIDALRLCQLIEKTAITYIAALKLGEPFILPDDEVTLLREKYLTTYGQRG